MRKPRDQPKVEALYAPSPPIPKRRFVLALIALHQIALTLIHYIIVPILGFDPQGSFSVTATIFFAALLVALLVARDLRTPGRRAAVMLAQPSWDARTYTTMIAGLAIAQIPLMILALQNATVWQAGPASSLNIARALLTSTTTIAGILLVAMSVLVAPLIEEVIYRGYLIASLSKRVPGFAAVIISATLFVTLHFEAANLVAALCLGIGTALCTVRTKSIFPGLLVHISSNAFGMWYATIA